MCRATPNTGTRYNNAPLPYATSCARATSSCATHSPHTRTAGTLLIRKTGMKSMGRWATRNGGAKNICAGRARSGRRRQAVSVTWGVDHGAGAKASCVAAAAAADKLVAGTYCVRAHTPAACLAQAACPHQLSIVFAVGAAYLRRKEARTGIASHHCACRR